jgi:putative transcriptional regulator
MKGHVDAERLADLVLGMLDEQARLEVEAHLAACARCATEHADVEEALSAVAVALPPLAPSPAARDRLLRDVRQAREPRLAWATKLAGFFDVTVEQARAILHKAAEPTAWEADRFPGMFLFHLRPGPKWAGADAGLVRFEGGVVFPNHEHVGNEYTLMLEGGVRFSDGSMCRAGDPPRHMERGTQHSFQVLDEGALYGLILFDGIEIPGVGIMRGSR